jgi:hypothetical protein
MPTGFPKGKSLKTMRGVPARCKISNADPITTVAMPFDSNALAVKLTV